MCLAVPGKIVKITTDMATVDYQTEKRQGKIIDGKWKVGDYCIIQGGILVMKVPKKEAEESLKNFVACSGP